jgi:bifunctional DNA primase/polymerase-like protein/primase-like protein
MVEDSAERSGLAYLRRGWAVVPVEARGKRPLVRWEEFQRRLPLPGDVAAWFRRWPNANIGIVTGKISGLAVVDVDPRHGGHESLAALEGEYAPLPSTVEVLTGGGGRHLYFASSGELLRSRVALAPGVDLRAEGGLVVAPPSIHASGGLYRWDLFHHPEDTPIAPLPSWLGLLVRSPSGGHPVGWWRQRVREPVPEGARNATLASLTGHLLWHGIDSEVALELLLCWNRVRCEPPLSEEEVARTIDSITRTHSRRREEKEEG